MIDEQDHVCAKISLPVDIAGKYEETEHTTYIFQIDKLHRLIRALLTCVINCMQCDLLGDFIRNKVISYELRIIR